MDRTLLLARTFFGRFFESELMPQGLPQVQLVIWPLALVAAPGLLLPVGFVLRYSAAANRGEPLTHAFLAHRLLFITLTMTVIGMVALVIWDGMFPDRRDARILSVLPVPGRILIAARLIALSALCGIFLVGVTAVPTIIYGAGYGAFGGASSAIHGVLAHFISTVLAGIFVFSALVALQGIVLNIGGRVAADRLSLLLQVTFVMLLLQMIFFLRGIERMVSTDLNVGWLGALPSMWFLGLYDVIGGRPAAGAASLALVALGATVVTTATAIVLFVGTHGRLTKSALEGVARQRRGMLAGLMVGRLIRSEHIHPVSRAVYDFTLRTLIRTRNNRLLMAMYVGVALAFIVSAILPLVVRAGLDGFTKPSIEILSAPLFLSFFTLIGMRVAFSIPVEPKASWTVRLSEPVNRAAAVAGVRRAMLVMGVLPSVVLAATSAMALWGTRAALAHVLVTTAMGSLLTELLLYRLVKVPFTCTYYPGNSKIRTLWPLYVSGFTTYTVTAAAFEWNLLRDFSLTPLVVFAVIVAGAIGVFATLRHLELGRIEGFVFEGEDPESIFGGFHLSEGFAAGTEESRQLR
jgi:hypothetical protein